MFKIKEKICSEPEYESIKDEINLCYEELDKYRNVYEAAVIINSFQESIKNFNTRIYTNYKKQIFFRHFFLQNFYDSEISLKEQFEKILINYDMICKDLEEYPEWLAKFKQDTDKLLAYSNIEGAYSSLYDKVDQQKIFK